MSISQQARLAALPPDHTPIPADAPERCVSCGETLTTPFCGQCGEQRASDRRYSLLQFGGEILEGVANFDGTLLRTLTTLIVRPGELTAAYMRGERSRYTKPLQIFVLASVAFFLVSVATNVHTFDLPLRIHIAQSPKQASMVAHRVADRHITLAQYAVVFDQASTAQAKTLVIIMVPVFALLVALLELRKRRYALQHLVFALHAYTALLIVMMALYLLVLDPLNLLLGYAARLLHTKGDGVLSLAVGFAIFVYLLLALRRTYLDGRFAAPVKALSLVAGMSLTLDWYRLVLFYTTFWMT
jgi:hypothetical protein